MKQRFNHETAQDFSIYLYSDHFFYPPIIINMVEGDLKFSKSESLFKNLAEAFLDHYLLKKIQLKEICLKVYDSLKNNRLTAIYKTEEL